MWMLLIKKLPTDPSPPRLSIFWSTPWPDSEWATMQQKRIDAMNDDVDLWVTDHYSIDPGHRTVPDLMGHGREPNWIGARRITYLGESIRVFPHEFNEQPVANMREFILSECPSHELVVSNVSGEMMMRDIKSGTRKTIYDAALIDGCNDAQALATAWGRDITLPDADFPPIGWYRCNIEYASYFYSAQEMVEEFSR